MSHPALRSLPAVGQFLARADVRAAGNGLAPEHVTAAVRELIADERRRRLAGEPSRDDETLAAVVVADLQAMRGARLRAVINATGVVINTNLGRSPLPAEALARVQATASGYANLEMDLETGRRGSRLALVEGLLRRVTGAEAALVVNNCAAAVLLVADTFGRGREVVVSRGQLIEIGGSFRLPDVLAASGAKLVEVGTTNRTYVTDYERALGPDTGLLLASHTSNYRVVGFTHEVSREELAALGAARGITTAEDLGSGLLVDLARWGLPPEPTVQEAVAAGTDLVMVSGDKLLGGPQCGLILGKREVVAKLKANQMLRALRVDKLALAALEGTLGLYLDLDRAAKQVPVLAMLSKPLAALQSDAKALAARLSGVAGCQVEVVEGTSAVGGGTLPGVELPTALVALTTTRLSLDELGHRLRTGNPSVVGRISGDRLLLDPRTLFPGDAARVATAVSEALA